MVSFTMPGFNEGACGPAKQSPVIARLYLVSSRVESRRLACFQASSGGGRSMPSVVAGSGSGADSNAGSIPVASQHCMTPARTAAASTMSAGLQTSPDAWRGLARRNGLIPLA